MVDLLEEKWLNLVQKDKDDKEVTGFFSLQTPLTA